MNLIERFFADPVRDIVREGSFRSVRQLVKEIESGLAEGNEHPKPCQWKAKGEGILAKIYRAKAAMERPSRPLQEIKPICKPAH